jgi:hypothetical protein
MSVKNVCFYHTLDLYIYILYLHLYTVVVIKASPILHRKKFG